MTDRKALTLGGDELYALLREYVNFFQLSMKLRVKEKLQGPICKHYDSAQTPYQRLMASGCLNEAHHLLLQEHFEKLDPLALLGEVEKRPDRLWSFAHWKAPAPGMSTTLRNGVTIPNC